MFQPWNPATIWSLPEVLSEWAAVIPLVCYLASYKRDYELVGQLALSGRLTVDIYPKLGVLYGISKLLMRGGEFIDQASTQGSASWTVWDVCWGSIFPCANGGASSMIIRHVDRTVFGEGEDMPDALPLSVDCTDQTTSPTHSRSPGARNASSRHASSDSSSSGRTLVNECSSTPKDNTNQSSSGPSPSAAHAKSPSIRPKPAKGHRRMQTLKVMQFTKLPQRRSFTATLNTITTSAAWHVILIVFFLSITVALTAFGLYGTAIILASGTIAKASCRAVQIERVPGYLQSNEQDKESYMLMGLHQNTCTWYLFTGDRGIVDSLLNKNMIAFQGSSRSGLLALVFKGVHAIQLIATTYVAASKGWDGVALVVLMLLNSVGRWTSNEYFLVKRWMETESVAVQSKTFNFTGRTMLLGAIQDFSESRVVAWMDDIVAPHPRRDAWLARLKVLGKRDQGDNNDRDVLHNESGRWSEHDWKTILLSSGLASLSAEVLRKEFPPATKSA